MNLKDMNKERLLEDLKEATEELLQTIKSIPEEQFNNVPKEGGWSPGQVVEHLIKVETGTVRLFSGPAETPDRDPEKLIEEIKDRFLDFSWKMTASGPIVPDEQPKDKTKALNKIQDIRQRLTSLIEIHDLTELVTGFDHPLFGKMTKAEWLVFSICHGKRHAHQIKEILSSLENKE